MQLPASSLPAWACLVPGGRNRRAACGFEVSEASLQILRRECILASRSPLTGGGEEVLWVEVGHRERHLTWRPGRGEAGSALPVVEGARSLYGYSQGAPKARGGPRGRVCLLGMGPLATPSSCQCGGSGRGQPCDPGEAGEGGGTVVAKG